MDAISKIGYINDGLLDYLEEKFPNKCPKPTDSNRDVWIKTGNAQVVETLRGLKYEQDNPQSIEVDGEEVQTMRRETR